jgi:hypothetical protein
MDIWIYMGIVLKDVRVKVIEANGVVMIYLILYMAQNNRQHVLQSVIENP